VYDALKAVSDYFTAHLATELGLIETARTLTPNSIARWVAMSTYENMTLQFPLIEILPDHTDTQYGNGKSPYNESGAYYEIHYINVEVGITGTDSDTIQRDLLLYRDAIRLISKDDPTYNAAFESVRLGTAAYSRLIASEKEKKFLKILQQTLLCRVKKL
jgi:hypothetical protein